MDDTDNKSHEGERVLKKGRHDDKCMPTKDEG
jgi:hypothetical protein